MKLVLVVGSALGSRLRGWLHLYSVWGCFNGCSYPLALQGAFPIFKWWFSVLMVVVIDVRVGEKG